MASGNSKSRLNFSENEKVLCFHGPLIYEAKVLKAESWTKEGGQTAVGPHYRVHYKGWKQTWDEWVPEIRLLKLNEENIARQKALMEAQRARDRAEREAANKEAKIDAKRKPDAVAGTSRKRGRDSLVDQEEEYLKRPEIKLTIPDNLKVQLVDDWEFITKNSQLVPLPRDPTVQEILRRYESSVRERKPELPTDLVREVLSGLQLYFDRALGNNLLYRFERNQYSDLRKKHAADSHVGDEVEMSSVYGAEHLLRLFVNLPEMIAHTNMDAHAVSVLKDHLSDILQWMSTEQKSLFVSQYDNASSAYQNLARG